MNWIRNGTIMGPTGTQIDLQRGDDWLTVRANNCEHVADEVLRRLNHYDALLAACKLGLYELREWADNEGWLDRYDDHPSVIAIRSAVAHATAAMPPAE